jgi:hypothetical protein
MVLYAVLSSCTSPSEGVFSLAELNTVQLKGSVLGVKPYLHFGRQNPVGEGGDGEVPAELGLWSQANLGNMGALLLSPGMDEKLEGNDK